MKAFKVLFLAIVVGFAFSFSRSAEAARVTYRWVEAGHFYQGWMWSYCNKYSKEKGFYIETVNGEYCDEIDRSYFSWELYPGAQPYCWRISARSGAHIEVVHGSYCD